MAGLKEFEPYSAFTRLDRDQKNSINGKDIAHFIKYAILFFVINLRQSGLSELFDSECNYLVKYFDSEFNGVLNYTE